MSKILAKDCCLIASGKGGVGKSTVSVNLAIALARQGKSVGLLDADLYGPSVPIMTGLRGLTPKVLEDCSNKVLPLNKFGVQIISIGFFVEESRPLIWRGPMLHGTLNKLVQDVEWGELDYLLVDW